MRSSFRRSTLNSQSWPDPRGGARRHPHSDVQVNGKAAERLTDFLRTLQNEALSAEWKSSRLTHTNGSPTNPGWFKHHMIGNRVSAEPAYTVDLPRMPPRSQPRCRRVRELVCAYRPLRDPEGRIISVPSVALSTPSVAAQITAPDVGGSAGGTVRRREPFGPRSPPRLARCLARNPAEHTGFDSGCLRASVRHARDRGLAAGAQSPVGRSGAERG